jgi:hypothetical protein
MINSSMSQSDVFFISYDEPAAEESWRQLLEFVPNAKRIHGVKGFDAAYKACAAQTTSERFFTIDGDNQIDGVFTDLEVDEVLLQTDAVLSWPAKNPINGLCYGNGGVKNWPQKIAKSMATHESADGPGSAVDFCFQLNYFQMPQPLSTLLVNSTAYQAFRGGFREGVKMCLDRGERPSSFSTENKLAHVWAENLNRLKIWCSVGADVSNGDWAMLGARMGCQKLCLSDWDHRLIRDYDWFQSYWQKEVEPMASSLSERLAQLELELNSHLHLGITTLSPKDSIFFKSVYVNPPRSGLMYK